MIYIAEIDLDFDRSSNQVEDDFRSNRIYCIYPCWLEMLQCERVKPVEVLVTDHDHFKVKLDVCSI